MNGFKFNKSTFFSVIVALVVVGVVYHFYNKAKQTRARAPQTPATV